MNSIQAIIGEAALFMASNDYDFVPLATIINFVVNMTNASYQLVEDTLENNRSVIMQLRDELRARAFDQILKRPY